MATDPWNDFSHVGGMLLVMVGLLLTVTIGASLKAIKDSKKNK